MKPVLIVGQGPSKSGEGKPALEGFNGSGKHLMRLAGLTQEQFEQWTMCTNLLCCWHGKNGKGDAFPMDAAKASAAVIKLSFPAYSYVLLLGNNVARAFATSAPVLTWHTLDDDGPFVAVIPHPSMVNRYWNSLTNCILVENFLKSLFHRRNEWMAL